MNPFLYSEPSILSSSDDCESAAGAAGAAAGRAGLSSSTEESGIGLLDRSLKPAPDRSLEQSLEPEGSSSAGSSSKGSSS